MSTAQNILAAAEAELLDSDPGSLRVDHVARAAAVNKRMIYHYFGGRSGLLEAVYARQLHRLLAPQAALSEGSKTVILALLGERYGTPGQEDKTANQLDLSAEALQCAARVLLPVLLNNQTSSTPVQAVSAAAWVSFCVDILSLAMARQAPLAFPAEPGTHKFMELSEHLLTRSKSRLRLTPDSRRHR